MQSAAIQSGSGAGLSDSVGSIYRFGPFTLSRQPPALYRDGDLVSLTPKSLATLLALISKAGTPVSKEELIATVWPGIAVEEASFAECLHPAQSLGAIAERQLAHRDDSALRIQVHPPRPSG